MRLPRLVFDVGLHEVVGQADRKIRVLEQDRAIGLAVEVGFVAAVLDQHAGLALFLRFALDEFEDVRMPNLERLHLGRAAGLAAALHHRGDLVINPHERQRAGGLAAAAELFAMRAERRKVRASAGAELEQHGLAPRELHDVFHVVLHALDEAGRPLRIFVRVVGLIDQFGLRIPTPVAGRAFHPVLMEQADVEPDGRVERAVLMQAEPGQLAIEPLAVLVAREVAVLRAPIGDRAADAVNDLPDGVLAFRRAVLAVEILADHDVGRKLAPRSRDFAVLLLEQQPAGLVLDLGRAMVPFDRLERIGNVGGTEQIIDRETAVAGTGGTLGGTTLGTRFAHGSDTGLDHGNSSFRVGFGHPFLECTCVLTTTDLE